MNLALSQILDLVGKLDDAPGNETPRERFRDFLKANVTGVGQVRDYVTECLNNPDSQHNRALQDLVNHVGRFLGFEVDFGRYQGVPGEVGFDGHWKSPTGFHLVVETKTSENFLIETATLLGYANKLIDKKVIPDLDQVQGLYVVGKLHPKVSQLENSIVAQKQTQHLRIVSADSLLSLAELMSDYDIGHDEVLTLLRPSRPTVDPVVALIARLVAEKPGGPPSGHPPGPVPEGEQEQEPQYDGEAAYWLTPVAPDDEQTAEECIQTLVGQEKIYAFSEKAPGRKHIKPGDRICFYATGKGVVAHARVASPAKHEPHPAVRHSEQFPWIFSTADADLYLDDPVVIDSKLRARLDAFSGKDLNKPWSWFVFTTHKVTQHDFDALTGPKS